MPNIKVTFERIDINKDGEAMERGKFYYKFSVNGVKVEERLSSSPLLVSSGETITLDSSRSIELKSSENLTVDGFVAERDSGLSGKDDKATFKHVYDESEKWGNGTREARLIYRGMDCNLVYNIQAG